MSSSMWQEAVDMIAQAASDTIPQVADLVSPPPRLVLFILADQLVCAVVLCAEVTGQVQQQLHSR